MDDYKPYAYVYYIIYITHYITHANLTIAHCQVVALKTAQVRPIACDSNLGTSPGDVGEACALHFIYIWLNYNDLTATSLGIMVSKGNHPQMASIQVSQILYFAQIYVDNWLLVWNMNFLFTDIGNNHPN